MSTSDLRRSKAPTDTVPTSRQVSAVVMQAGGGEVVMHQVRRVVEYITPAEFAAQVGLSRNSVYRHIGTEALPDRLVAMPGPRKIRIHASAVPHFLDYWRLKRGAS